MQPQPRGLRDDLYHCHNRTTDVDAIPNDVLVHRHTKYVDNYRPDHNHIDYGGAYVDDHLIDQHIDELTAVELVDDYLDSRPIDDDLDKFDYDAATAKLNEYLDQLAADFDISHAASADDHRAA